MIVAASSNTEVSAFVRDGALACVKASMKDEADTILRIEVIENRHKYAGRHSLRERNPKAR